MAIGLSADQCGFLSWYKAHHPQGRIVTFNFKQLPYLNDTDYFIKGDVQTTLPALQIALIALKAD